MKKTVAVLMIFCVLACGIFLLSACKDEEEPPKLLYASGKDILDGDGNVVHLRGVNAGGYLVQEGWMCPTDMVDHISMMETLEHRFGKQKAETLLSAYMDGWWQEKDFENIKNLGFNVIRLPFAYFNVESGGVYDFSRLDWFVSKAEGQGLYVILDLHGAYGSQNGKDHSGDTSQINLFGNEENENKTVALWKAVSAHYKNNQAVAGYDLLNEPEGETGKTKETQWAFYKRIIEEIRKNDDKHLIFVESVWDVGNLPAPSYFEDENIVYEYHNYQWENHDDFDSQKKFVDSKIAWHKLLDHGVPVFVGEFSCFANEESWKYTLQKYNENGMSWTLWTYKVIGLGSSWGLYTADMPGVDIENDSYEDIMEKWSGLSTEGFTKNQMLHNLFPEYSSGAE